MLDNQQDDIRKLRQENLLLRTELKALKTSRRSEDAFRVWLGRHFANFMLGKGLRVAMMRLYNELPGPVSKDTMADLSSHLVWRITRIGVFAFMVAVVPLLVLVVQTIILSLQNNKLDFQNQLIVNQNRRLDQQIHLDEAHRRSSFVFLMDNILEQIDEELQVDRRRTLSDELIGRIVSLTQALRPYRYLEGDELTSRALSPERGQLLFALVNSELDRRTYDKIFERANFSYADLREANLSGAYLKGANLNQSYFSNANFSNANLSKANFSGAYLENAMFTETYMPFVRLAGANLRKSHFEDVIMHDADLRNCDMREISLSGNFSRVQLEGVQLRDGEINDVILDHASFRSQEFLERLGDANIRGFYLIEDYYRIERKISNSGLYKQDTTYFLRPREDKSARMLGECERRLVDLLYSSPEIRNLDRSFKGKGVELYVVPGSLPTQQDSTFIFQLTTGKVDSPVVRMTVAFQLATGQLFEMSAKTEENANRELNFDQSLLQLLPAECLSGKQKY